MSKIQIRFNTEKDKTDASLPAWRVLVDGVEALADEVQIQVPTWTTEDILPSGLRKWHLSCEGQVDWAPESAKRVCRILANP